MTQEQEHIVSYQWIKGEKIGSIEEVDKTEQGFTYFKSGNRIRTDLLTEFMIETLEGEIPIQQDIEAKSDPTAGLAVAGSTDPTAGLKIAGSTERVPGAVEQVNAAIPDSPIVALLNKMGNSSKDTIEVSLSVSVKIPKKETFSILAESFGEEVLENVEGLALAQIDEEKVQEELKSSIRKVILKYYK